MRWSGSTENGPINIVTLNPEKTGDNEQLLQHECIKKGDNYLAKHRKANKNTLGHVFPAALSAASGGALSWRTGT